MAGEKTGLTLDWQSDAWQFAPTNPCNKSSKIKVYISFIPNALYHPSIAARKVAVNNAHNLRYCKFSNKTVCSLLWPWISLTSKYLMHVYWCNFPLLSNIEPRTSILRIRQVTSTPPRLTENVCFDVKFDWLPWELLEIVLTRAADLLFVTLNKLASQAGVTGRDNDVMTMKSSLTSVSGVWYDVITSRVFYRRQLRRHFDCDMLH
jgi:hypothetical protein